MLNPFAPANYGTAEEKTLSLMQTYSLVKTVSSFCAFLLARLLQSDMPLSKGREMISTQVSGRNPSHAQWSTSALRR
jgi:hypothetical protein